MPINIDSGVATRVGVYARYSSDLQRPTSIEDQIRECRDAAAHDGWTVQDEFIRFDEAKTGQLAGRDGLDALLEFALQSPRPFDGIIIDDTSRIGAKPVEYAATQRRASLRWRVSLFREQKT